MATTDRISYIRFRNYKPFSQLHIDFGENAVLVGPNSAGKSSVIEALRASAEMIRYAKRRNPEIRPRSDRGKDRLVYPFDSNSFGIDLENLRFEFREDREARFELGFSGHTAWRLFAVFPPDLAEDPFFYLETKSGGQAGQAKWVQEALLEIGVVPQLSPIEPKEVELAESTIQRGANSHLFSRHFRNHLLLLHREDRLADFLEFAELWAPEMPLTEPTKDWLTEELDVFYQEGRGEREIAWAGQGYQVWLQILLKLFQLGEVDVLILDEPEVFLHPDLQRRLIRLLRSRANQFVLATHSAEIANESSEDLVWIEKGRKKAVLAPEGDELVEVSDALGTGVNLALARALRARVCLFVEGDDLKLLRPMSTTLGLTRLDREDGIAAVSLGGRAASKRLEAFEWVASEILADAVVGYVILDRDYSDENAIAGLVNGLANLDIESHVWERKELESYLLDARTIARLTSLPTRDIEAMLEEILEDLRNEVFDSMLSTRFAERDDRGEDVKTTIGKLRSDFERKWSSADGRMAAVPPKVVLGRINDRLQAVSTSALSFRRLARSMTADEIPDEVRRVLREIHDAADKR